MIAPRISWRSPWPRLIPLLLLVMMPAAGQYLGWLIASPLGESVSLLPGWASWTVILAMAALLTGWSGLLTSPSLRVETGAQMPGASLAFGAAALHAMSAQGVSKDFAGVAGFAYGLACLWLCANAFGSEFDHRTMGQLLVQPRSRGRIYREKLGVAGSLAGLAAVIFFLTPSRSMAGDPQSLGETLGYLILGLASAPFFTLISRSTLAGFVFTLAVPMALYLVLQTLLDVYHARVYPDLVDRSREELALLWAGVVIYLGAMALASWRVFKRLEWREGGSGGGSAPGLHALTGAWDRWIGRRWLGQHATAQLIRKELRLHVVPWLIAGILIGFWGLSLLIRKWAPESEWGVAAANPYTVTLYAGIFGTFVLLATGASAIAEERVLGTLEWQWTQPIPMARQWRIKVGVAAALALTLGLILPATLVWLGFDAEALDTTFGQPDWQQIAVYAMALVALFATSLYASSVSQSSMEAVALTPLLLASLWAVGALTIWGVVATFDDGWGNLWFWPDSDGLRDPSLLNQKPPAWLPVLETLRRMAEVGAIVLGTIWIGFVVRSARVNAQQLRIGRSNLSRQWGRLSGGLWMASILGGLLLVGLGRMRGTYDQLSFFQSQRERLIRIATHAEQDGKFTPEYLSPLGITNQPLPQELVDTLIRQRGFRGLRTDLPVHFLRKPGDKLDPALLMDPALARRYGLQAISTSPVSTTPSTNAASPDSTAPAPQPMMMSRELMLRYGLLPKRQPGATSTTPSTNAASPESASTAPMPMMSPELMKRYGLIPRTTTNRASPAPQKASTNPPANTAPRQ
jgi:hypothetical protein